MLQPILLFGAALNAVGELPDVELQSAIEASTRKLQAAGLTEDPQVKAVLRAATERAQFDRIGEMLRRYFRAGLVASGRYDAKRIESLVPRIVNATHRVRHEAIVDLEGWAESEPDQGRYFLDASRIQDKPEFTDPFFQVSNPDAMMFGKPLFSELAGPARDACAFSLMLRLRDLAHPSGA